MLAPLGPIERGLPQADDLRIRPAIGWMLAGLPQMQGDALTFLDRPIELRLEGPGGGAWLVRRETDGPVVIAEPAGETTSAASIRSSAMSFVVWGTKRSDWRDDVELEGDHQLATRFLDTLNIV